MTMAGLYFAIEIAVLLMAPGASTGILPFVIGGFALKLAGAWLGSGGSATRASANSRTTA
jgi:hypothetical protein